MPNVQILGFPDPFEQIAYFEFDPFKYGDSKNYGNYSLDGEAPDFTQGSPGYVSAGYYEFGGTDTFAWDRDNESTGPAWGVTEWLARTTNVGLDQAAVTWSKDDALNPIGWTGYDSGTIRDSFETSGGNFIRTWNRGTAANNEWVHVLINLTSSGTRTCYVNGVSVSVNTTSGTSRWWDDVDNTNPSNIAVGGQRFFNSGYYNEWNGDIGRVAIYNELNINSEQAFYLAKNRLGRYS